VEKKQIRNPAHIFLRLWVISSFILACLILLSTITEQDNVFQPWDFNSPSFKEIHLDNFLRSLVNLSVTMIAGIIILLFRDSLMLFKKTLSITILLITAPGMVLGLGFPYYSFCCMSPPTYFLGFPFIWLYGKVIGEANVIVQPEISYLLQHLFITPWHIHLWGLINSLNFWFCLSVILTILLRKLKSPTSVST
jgi:hypothetical protein